MRAHTHILKGATNGERRKEPFFLLVAQPIDLRSSTIHLTAISMRRSITASYIFSRQILRCTELLGYWRKTKSHINYFKWWISMASDWLSRRKPISFYKIQINFKANAFLRMIDVILTNLITCIKTTNLHSFSLYLYLKMVPFPNFWSSIAKKRENYLIKWEEWKMKTEEKKLNKINKKKNKCKDIGVKQRKWK